MKVEITTRYGLEVYLVTYNGTVHSFMSIQGAQDFVNKKLNKSR